MAPRGQIRWNRLEEHLGEILPGYRCRVSTHSRMISWQDRAFAPPRGAHGEGNPEIQSGQIRKMFRHFGKLPEAKARIPQLR